MIKLYENINVDQTEYYLKGKVRSYNKHLLAQLSFKENQNGTMLMIFAQG